jgi:hypothetical protein
MPVQSKYRREKTGVDQMRKCREKDKRALACKDQKISPRFNPKSEVQNLKRKQSPKFMWQKKKHKTSKLHAVVSGVINAFSQDGGYLIEVCALGDVKLELRERALQQCHTPEV